jgi:hypothetical protein
MVSRCINSIATNAVATPGVIFGELHGDSDYAADIIFTFQAAAWQRKADHNTKERDRRLRDRVHLKWSPK